MWGGPSGRYGTKRRNRCLAGNWAMHTNCKKKSRMTVAKLSAKTAISTRFIEYIEAGEFSKLPGRSHVLGFTRSICRELALDAEEIVQAIKSAMYPDPMTEFELTIAQQMKRPLIAKIVNAFKSVLDWH